MGHTRIGKLHPTKNWKDLIACFQVGAKYPQFAHQVLEAVSDGLNERKLIEDAGYQKSVELLVEMAIGAQRKDFIGHMREMGIGLSDNPPPQELIAKVADAIEEASWAGGRVKTDLAEFSKKALSNAITRVFHDEKSGFFSKEFQPSDLAILGRFGKKDVIADMNRYFISQTLAHALNAYISMVLPNLADDDARICSIHELKVAYDAIATHCYELSLVHVDYSNHWLGKYEYQLCDMSERLKKKHGAFLVEKMMKALRAYE